MDIAVKKARNQIRKYFCSLIHNYATSIELETLPSDDSRQVAVSLRTGDLTGVDDDQRPKTEKRRSASVSEGRRNQCRRESDLWRVNRIGARAGNDNFEGNVSEYNKASGLRGEWWIIDDDSYIYDNLCGLLRNAEYEKELKWLLVKPQWIVKRLQEEEIY